MEVPPSLVNIYQELHDDLGCYIPNNGYLKKWADQGVMLLNTVLTVRAHAPFPTRTSAGRSSPTRPSASQPAGPSHGVYTWGRPCSEQEDDMLNNPKHLIRKRLIPARCPRSEVFFGSRPFSKTNQFLTGHGLEPIDRQIENI